MDADGDHHLHSGHVGDYGDTQQKRQQEPGEHEEQQGGWKNNGDSCALALSPIEYEAIPQGLNVKAV
jgi:hypothetical protein